MDSLAEVAPGCEAVPAWLKRHHKSNVTIASTRVVVSAIQNARRYLLFSVRSMSDPSFAFVLKLRSFMADPPRSGAPVQPAPIRALPAHSDIPNRGSTHRGTRKEDSRSLGGSIDRQTEPIET